jgi:FKBP-type peptidyl-prolyl cis-trans isomerase (trigger factor)
MDTRAKGQQQVEFILGQEMFPEFLEKQILGMKVPSLI